MRIALLATLFTFIAALRAVELNDNVQNSDDHAFEWIENIVKSPYMFQQTVGFLEYNSLISPLAKNGLDSLHTEGSTLPVLMTANCPVDDKPYFPLHSPYMRAMRISAMIKHDVTWLYTHNGGILAPTEIVSLANERTVIRFTSARVQSLHEYLPPGTMLLTQRDINRCLRSFEEFLSIANEIVNSLLMYDDPFYPRTYREPYSSGVYCNVSLLVPYLSADGETVQTAEIEKLMSSDTLQTRPMVLTWISHYLKYTIRPYLLSDKCISDTALYRFYRRDVLDVYAINWNDLESMQDSNISRQRFMIFQTPVNENRQITHFSPTEGDDKHLIQQLEQHNTYINNVCVSRVRKGIEMLHSLYLFHNLSFPSPLLSFLNDDQSHVPSSKWQCSNWIRDVFEVSSPLNIIGSNKQSETRHVNITSLYTFFESRYKNLSDPTLLPNLRKSLNRASFSKQEDHMLDSVYKREGGGCSSTAQFTCIKRNAISPTEDDVFPARQQLCVWHTNYIHTYIATQLTVGLALRPDRLWTASFRQLVESAGIEPSHLSLSSISVSSEAFQQESIQAPRFLSVGLAGGSIHNFVRLHFPAAYIESVDIDVSALDLYLRYFQPVQMFETENLKEVNSSTPNDFETGRLPAYSSLDIMVCGIKYLLENTDFVNESVSQPEPIRSKYSLIELPVHENHYCNSSYLVWANGYNYINYLAAEIEQLEQSGGSSPDLYFDQVLLDAYDARALDWSGRKNEGISLSFVPQTIDSLESIRKILRPGSGLVQFHLHKDRQFNGLVHHIIHVFGGPRNIVMIDVGVEAIVIASRDVYTTSPHPCDNVEEFAHWVKTFSKLLLFPHGMAESSQYGLRCNWLEDLDFDETIFSSRGSSQAKERAVEIDDTGNIRS